MTITVAEEEAVEAPTEDEGLTHIVCWLRPDEPPTRDGYTRTAHCGWDVSGHRMITRHEPHITCRVCEDLEPHHAGCSPQAGCLVK